MMVSAALTRRIARSEADSPARIVPRKASSTRLRWRAAAVDFACQKSLENSSHAAPPVAQEICTFEFVANHTLAVAAYRRRARPERVAQELIDTVVAAAPR